MNPEELKALGELVAQKALAGIAPTIEEVKLLNGTIKTLSEDVALIKSKTAVSLPGLEDEKKNWKWARVIKGITTGSWDGAGFEKEVMAQARSKALAAGSGAAGGFLVPIEFAKDLVALIYANSILDKVGVTRLNATGSPLEIPRLAGGATAYWVGENQAITSSQQTTDQLVLSPKMVAGLVKTSVRLVNQADISVEQMIMNDIAKAIALAIDIKAFNGDGTNNTPIGILNTVGIKTWNPAGGSGDVATYDLFTDIIGAAEDANTLTGNLAFAMNPKVARILKKQKVLQYSGDTAGMPVFAPVVSDEVLAQNLGYGIQKSTQIPNVSNLSPVFFGNWADFIMAQWGGLLLETSTQAGDASGGAFSSHQVWFKAVAEVDFGLRHPESFVVDPNVKTV